MRQAVFPASLAQAVRDTGFSPAIRAGDFIYLTGATGGGSDGIMPTDAKQQAENALGKAMQVLQEAGADEGSVVEITSYHIAIGAHFATIQQVMEQVFTPPLPAWTAVEVAGLRRPQALVEFRIVAHCPPPDASLR